MASLITNLRQRLDALFLMEKFYIVMIAMTSLGTVSAIALNLPAWIAAMAGFSVGTFISLRLCFQLTLIVRTLQAELRARR